jgi:4-amino-4-deoxy-L-arabinose transferase-like glycosyltransferase
MATQPEIMRTPGYPVFLLLCGYGATHDHGIAQIVQALIGVASVLVTYLIALRFFDSKTASWAAALQAINIGCISNGLAILTECLFSFFLACTLLFLVRYLQKPAPWTLPLAAGTTAAATYVRPVGIVFVPVVVGVLIYAFPRAWMRAAQFVLLFGVMVAPWYVRNYHLDYKGFSSISDQNLLEYEAPGVLMHVERVPLVDARKALEDTYLARLKQLNLEPNSGPAMKVAGTIGKSVILEHPVVWFRMHMTTSLATMLPASSGMLEALGVTTGNRGTLAVLQTQGIVAAMRNYFGNNLKAVLLVVPELFYLALQYGFLVLFAILAIKQHGFRWSPSAWLLVLTALVFIFVGGPAATPRFRVPVEPLLNVGAAAGIQSITMRRKVHTDLPIVTSPA